MKKRSLQLTINMVENRDSSFGTSKDVSMMTGCCCSCCCSCCWGGGGDTGGGGGEEPPMPPAG